MVKRLCLVFTLTFLLSVALFPLQAQDDSTACHFEPNPSATVFDNLEKVSELGIKPEDINELAKAAQDPSVDATEFLVSKGYDEAKIKEILADPANAHLINQLVHPSPSRDILDRAYALLGSYGIPSGALTELYKLTSDQAALHDNLIGRGLSPEQADGLISAAMGLVAEAQKIGVFDYAATLDGQDVFDNHGYYDQMTLNSVSNDLDDPQALRETLIKEGVSESDADSIVGELQTLHDEQGLTENYMDGWQTKSLAYSLDYYGIPSEEILSLASQGDSEAIGACLADAGFDPSAIDIALSELDNYLVGEDGEDPLLTQNDIAEAALDDAGVLGAEWGFSGADLADLSQYADDPDALHAALINNYGFSADDADLFGAEFDNSIFSAVFNEVGDEAITQLDEAITSAENGEYFTLSDDFDVESIVTDDDASGSETGDDTGGEDTSGDETGDDTGGEDTGGEDTSGDDTGGEGTSGGETDGEDTSGSETGGDAGGEDTSGGEGD